VLNNYREIRRGVRKQMRMYLLCMEGKIINSQVLRAVEGEEEVEER
jgi:hypothetical protein